MKHSGFRVLATLVVLALGVVATSGVAHAVMPVVKTVPWLATNPLIPHDTWSGKSITLKGTSDQQAANFEWTWDFGDGTPVATGTVTNRYAIEATHTYTGAEGTIFTARLSVRDTTTNETASKEYYVKIQAQSLEIEVNRAIDEGLWYLHKTMRRYNDGMDKGDWLESTSCGTRCASSTYYAVTPANLNAFLSNGHSEAGSASNPYTETVQRGMRRLFEFLLAEAIPATEPAPPDGVGTFSPDSNGNGLGIRVNQSDYPYQGGPFLDAIVATGTPNAVVPTGGANIAGRTYGDIVQDMVDSYAYGMYDPPAAGYGGWRYGWENFPDNSANQWAAVGIIAAERSFGTTVPPEVKVANVNWLVYSPGANGAVGYTAANSFAWGPYAVTPSGMVQMVMNGIGRGNAGPPSWDTAETYLRDRFHNTGGASNAIKDYYYGLFSFTKSMLLHDANGDGVSEPITLLQSSTAGVDPIDWYAAQQDLAQPNSANNTDGVARTLINDQNAAGYWYGHNYYSLQYPFETAWAVLMLNRTVFESGLPVAVATATPNPAVAGQTIQLSGAGSFHQDPTKSIVMWEWDLDNDGTYDVSNVATTVSFPAVGNYPVKLRVTDDSVPAKTAVTTVTIIVSTPPLPPTAEAGGPYNFCTNKTPWFLDGTASSNPDEGQSEPGMPPDTITEYAWELSGDNSFNDALGAQPDVTAFFQALGVGNYLVQLRVTDNTAAAYPSSGMPNLTDTDSAQVNVKDAGDPACSCVSDLTANVVLNGASFNGRLRWTWRSGAIQYNVYRGTAAGGPYAKIATVSTQVVSGSGIYFDTSAPGGAKYFWVVREAALNGDELCQSNEASATLRGR